MLQTPPMVLPPQRETRGFYMTDISGTQPIIIPHQSIALGATSEAHWLLAYMTIRSDVVAEAGAGSNEANRRSVQDARDRNILMF